MTTQTLELIKQLRQETGAGVLDCRRALEEASQHYETALAALREKAAAAAARRADRQACQGTLELYSHGGGRIGVMVEVNSETDFAARSETFRTFAHEIALHIAAAAPLYVREEDIPLEVLAEVAEKASAEARAEGKPEPIVERIVTGKLDNYKSATVLLRQPFVRDEKLSVAQLLHQAAASVGENIQIRRFVRWELSEDGQ